MNHNEAIMVSLALGVSLAILASYVIKIMNILGSPEARIWMGVGVGSFAVNVVPFLVEGTLRNSSGDIIDPKQYFLSSVALFIFWLWVATIIEHRYKKRSKDE